MNLRPKIIHFFLKLALEVKKVVGQESKIWSWATLFRAKYFWKLLLRGIGIHIVRTWAPIFLSIYHDRLQGPTWKLQLLRFQFEAHGKFTRERQKEKITKIVWFYQGWALQMEKNIQWSQSVQIWGGQRPLRLWKVRLKNQKIKKSKIRVFQLLLFWFTKREVVWGGSNLSANWFQKEPRRPHAVPRKTKSNQITPPLSKDAPAQGRMFSR